MWDCPGRTSSSVWRERSGWIGTSPMVKPDFVFVKTSLTCSYCSASKKGPGKMIRLVWWSSTCKLDKVSPERASCPIGRLTVDVNSSNSFSSCPSSPFLFCLSEAWQTILPLPREVAYRSTRTCSTRPPLPPASQSQAPQSHTDKNHHKKMKLQRSSKPHLLVHTHRRKDLHV